MLLSLAGGCGRTSSSTAPSAPSFAPVPATPADYCAPAGSSPAGPISDPNGPYFHRVAVGRTADGVKVSDVVHVLEHASVPDGVRLPTGEILVYYVDAADNSLGVASLTATAARPLGGVPELDTLADGRVRLYVCAQGIQSYVSADRGSTWVREGTVLNPGGLICDP